ncbi:MAG: M42 family peptidase [Anaerolineales bacterium]|nr:MAG: M42 family peptidase [Anaerolineales bacterium]
MPDLINTLQQLSDIPGVSGDETQVRNAIKPLLVGHVDSMRVDALGNLITHKKGTGENPLRVMIAAHMDEVGLMVVGYNSDGTLQIETIGGIPARTLPGLHVRIGKDLLPGVIGVKAIHRAAHSDRNKAPELSALAVDLGATSTDEAKRIAPLGTSITFATKFHDLGETLYGKAFDDRAGCAILLKLLQGLPFPFDVYGVFTVQEEIELRGATVAAYSVEPDIALVLEGTLADEYPREDTDTSTTTQLGSGPAITVKDRSYITPPRLLRHFLKTAEALAQPYQLKQPGIGGTDAGSIHKSRGGVPTIAIAVPCRYIHSPVSLTRKSDVMATKNLADAALRTLTPDIIDFRE